MNNELQAIEYELEPVIKRANGIIEIIDKVDYTEAGDVLKTIKNRIKNIEDKRKSWTKPMDDAKKAIMADVKEVLFPLQELEKFIKGKMLDYVNAEQKKLEAEQKLIDEKAKSEIEKTGKSNVEVPDLVARQDKTVRGDFGTSTVKQTVSFEIEDITQIPMTYYELNERAILEDVKKGIDIPGVKKVMKKSIAIR